MKRIGLLLGMTGIFVAVAASGATASRALTPSECIARYNALIAALKPPDLAVPATPAAIHTFKVAGLVVGQEMQALYQAKITQCPALAKPGGITRPIGRCVGPTPEHTRLMREPGVNSPAVKAALAKAHARIQSNKDDAPRAFAFDRFEITMDKMPPGISPSDYLQQFAADPNATVGDSVEADAFAMLTRFQRRGSDPVGVGTIYDIAIPGDSGSVVVVEDTPTHFVVQTIETPANETGRHPVSGQREFGFTTNADGSVTFYTEGADRPDHENLRTIGSWAQNATWTMMMFGIQTELAQDGGAPRSNSFKFWRKDVVAGC